ncbi:hypothetical protein SDC9_87788 [bioreactor metagenome]|uniref:Uncharacterized protein n=1 Tax=bioreactor metagenome TaxID=1076179 RepID=A0A644ZLB4_9ZZZZ
MDLDIIHILDADAMLQSNSDGVAGQVREVGRFAEQTTDAPGSK